jgi:hypothetical protein
VHQHDIIPIYWSWNKDIEKPKTLTWNNDITKVKLANEIRHEREIHTKSGARDDTHG